MASALKNGGSKKYALTWFAPRNCWKRKYRGKIYYSPRTEGKTDKEGYQAALDWWSSKSKELDGIFQAQQIEAEAKWTMTREEFRQDSQAATARLAYEQETADKASYEQWKESRIALNLVRSQGQMEVDPKQTVKAYVDRFLDFKKAQSVAGQKSNGRFVNIRIMLGQFASFVGENKEAKSVNWTVAFGDYYSAKLTEVGEGKLSESGAADKLQVARQFIRRLWSLGIIELPRNLDDKELKIERSETVLDLPPFKEFKKIVDSAPEVWANYYPLRLYLLLMANCGMTQKDISDLKQHEIDWNNGTIRRKRSKKSRRTSKNVPIVQYKLWKETFDLLKKYRSTATENVLLNRTGGALRATALSQTDNRKAYNTDLIADSYNSWLESKNIKEAPSLKMFRKASSSRFGEHKEYARFAQYFLCHTAKNTADKHYIQPSQAQFDKALIWLGKEYGREV